HGPIGLVAVRGGPAEVRQDAVTEVLSDATSVARDDLFGAVVVPLHEGRIVLGIEPVGEGGRADEVAEDDGELAALAAVLREPRPTGGTEAGADRVAGPAGRACIRGGLVAHGGCLCPRSGVRQ